MQELEVNILYDQKYIQYMSGSPTKQVGFSIKFGSNTGLEKPPSHDISHYTSTTYNISATYIERPVILCIKREIQARLTAGVF